MVLFLILTSHLLNHLGWTDPILFMVHSRSLLFSKNKLQKNYKKHGNRFSINDF